MCQAILGDGAAFFLNIIMKENSVEYILKLSFFYNHVFYKSNKI